jgi:membrane associated rhomboid family serine protease
MDKREVEKVISLCLALTLLLVCLCATCELSDVGLRSGCGLTARLLYPFFHANLLHLAINLYVLLSFVFLGRISLCRLCAAYLVAVSVPIGLLASLFPIADKPIVGLSGVLFYLSGVVSFEVPDKSLYQLTIWINILVGLVLPATSVTVHLYCFVVGIIVAVLNRPFER